MLRGGAGGAGSAGRRGTGEGRTKKEAEQAAALEACEVLGDDMNGAVGASDDNTRGGAATGTGGDHG